MKIFTLTNAARMLLLTAAAMFAVGLAGCQGDEGGGDLVGDWTPYSSSYGGETHYVDDDEYSTMILSFSASGKLEPMEFEKIGNVWVEASMGVGTYRVSGSKLYIKSPSGSESESVQYRVSGNYLTIIPGYGYEVTYKRINLAEFRRSLGTVYTNDPKLSSSASYDDLIWYSQDDENEHIEFYGTNVHGNGLYRYADDDDMSYYTNGNKLVLVSEDCDWDYDYDERHCTVSGTYQLTYKITGGGRDMQLSINGDIWLPAESNDYWGYSYKRPIRTDTGKGFFAPFAAPSGHSSR